MQSVDARNPQFDSSPLWNWWGTIVDAVKPNEDVEHAPIPSTDEAVIDDVSKEVPTGTATAAEPQQVEEIRAEDEGQLISTEHIGSKLSQLKSTTHHISLQISLMEKTAGIELPPAGASTRIQSLSPTETTNRSARSGLSSFRLPILGMMSNRIKVSDTKVVAKGINGLSLHAALNNPAQLKVLLSYDTSAANVRDFDGDRFPIHWAAARGHMRCLRALLKAGADTSVLDLSDRTPAELALANGANEAHNLIVYGEPLPDPKPMSSTMMQDALSLHCALNQPKELARILDKVLIRPDRTMLCTVSH